MNLSFQILIFSPFQHATAPSKTDSLSLPITFFSSKPKIEPYPSHSLQAPYGLLKAKRFTEGSSNLILSNSNLFEKVVIFFPIRIEHFP